ncbi:MAG: hypothetical protein IJ824_00865 [Alphaproteobacteria bacterium]|nr:hypothetical protein [Alphaproteobacteria bacterium]
MSAEEILDNNYELKGESFLYYLQEKHTFYKEGLRLLCESIYALAEENVNLARRATKINFIYGAVLKCFMYHFDAEDPYKIINMPENYNRMIGQLEKCVNFYFSTRIAG